MKIRRTLLVSLFLIPAIAAAEAEAVYEYAYSPSLLPAENGSILYSGSNDGHDVHFTTNQGTRPYSLARTKGCLKLTTVQDSSLTFAVFKSSLPLVWSGWKEGRSTVVEVVAKVQLQAVDAQYVNGFRLISTPIGYFFYIGDGFIGFGKDGSGEEMTTHAMDTSSDFHTYRIVLGDDRASVYVDGGTEPALTGNPRTTSAASRIEWGDPSGTQGGGEILYQAIRWSNNLPNTGGGKTE